MLPAGTTIGFCAFMYCSTVYSKESLAAKEIDGMRKAKARAMSFINTFCQSSLNEFVVFALLYPNFWRPAQAALIYDKKEKPCSVLGSF